MIVKKWFPTYGRIPQAAKSLDYVWVQSLHGEVWLHDKRDEEYWEEISYWKPTQIRNPKPNREKK